MTTNNDSTSGTGSTDAMLQKMMEQGFKQLDQADKNAARTGAEEKNAKLFGLIEMPEMVVTVAEGLWNEFIKEATHSLEKATFPKFTQAARFAGLRGMSQQHTAAGATIVLSTVLKGAPYINPVVAGFKKQHQAYQDLAKKAAPVLDELKGHHSVTLLKGFKEQDNELFYYAHQRLKMTTRTEIGNNVANLIINLVPNMALSMPGHKKLWNEGVQLPPDAHMQGAKNWLSRIVTMGSPIVSRTITNSNARKLKQKLATPYSALDMVLELAQQVENNPKASSFQLPGGRNAGSAPLEKYIEQICYTHQKNMAEINPDHVEIRTALKDDLTAAVKPLAEAIRKGEMSATALVRLIGEGKIIKGRGRSVAGVEDITALIEKEEAQPTRRHANPKEHYKDTPYNMEQDKKALQALEGEDRDFFIALHPEEVLKAMGVSDSEIKASQTAALKHYNGWVANAVMGITAEPEAALKSSLSQSQVKGLNKVQEKITATGEEAVQEFKAGPTNPKGVEQDILDWAVNTINGDKAHFGTVLEQGRAKLEARESKKTDQAPDVRAKISKNGFVSADHDEDAMPSHARREEHRHAKAQERHHSVD